jgi:cold shock CspA family protein
MPVGTIVRMGRKGFGFIEPSDDGPRVFFHLKECFLRNVYLNVGDRVTYELNQFVRTGDGLRRACEVRVISDGSRGPYTDTLLPWRRRQRHLFRHDRPQPR